MKFVLDVHISYKVRDFLIRRYSCKAIHVNDILNSFYSSDFEISNYADQNGCIVITKDVDFKNSHLLKKTPAKLIRICLGNISNKDLIFLLTKYWPKLTQVNIDYAVFYCELSLDGLTLIA